MNYINKTILVTGATGYIGSVLIEKFKSSIGSWFDEDGNPIAKA